jgi:hypothetical protein
VLAVHCLFNQLNQPGTVRHVRIQTLHGSALKYVNLENVPGLRVTSMTLCVIILIETLFLLETPDDVDQEMTRKNVPVCDLG